MKLAPLYDQILIRRKESGEKSAGGIIIPDNAKETPGEGEVLAVGNGRKLHNGTLGYLQVTAGDRVLFKKYAGCDVVLDGEKFLLIEESDILGVFS